MPFAAGNRLGSYLISGPLGAGGMGEVYRATDTKLGRDVAIKVLPETLARDPERLRRFEREAKVLAALNHPNIAQIYGVEDQALVMELVEGESLKGPLPPETALDYARQIADALEAAHEKGIIHRDLKPANIMITPAGVVKVLDFGLAAVVQSSTAIGTDPEHSPTLMIGATQAGLILGTAAYMAPEQARGKAVDKRADIWAFGVVLHEMLTGRRLFGGEDVSDTLAAVIKDEPSWDRIPAEVRPLLERCLQKDPRKRLRDIGDAMLLLVKAPGAPAVAPRRRLPWALVAAFGLISLVATPIALLHVRESPAAAQLVRFQIFPPEKHRFAGGSVPSLSPDGQRIAFLATSEEGDTMLWVRSLSGLEATALTGTRAASPIELDNRNYFWSPDSRFLAFGMDGKLKKIDVSGGTVQTLCDVPGRLWGGAWSPDGTILFGGDRGLWRVSDAGGSPISVTTLDASRQDMRHGMPDFLSDGRHFLYSRDSSHAESSGVYLGSLEDGPSQREKNSSKPLVASRAADLGAPLYVPSRDPGMGYVLFPQGDTLMARRFDNARLELTGQPTPIAQEVGNNLGRGFLSASTRVLAYRRNRSRFAQLAWFDQQGKVLATVGEPGSHIHVSLSPDGNRMATTWQEGGDSGRNQDIWLYEFARNIRTRFTTDMAGDQFPVWSPDGSRIAFASDRDGVYNLYQKAASGVGKDELLLKSNENKFPLDWSHDGRYLLYSSVTQKRRSSLWIVPVSETGSPSGPPTQYLSSEFDLHSGRFSPDARWIAYVSNESGRNEVYVQPFPDPSGGKWTVSKDGGTQPRWRRNGKELYYGSVNGRLSVVDLTVTPAFRAGIPRVLPLLELILLNPMLMNNVYRYDVTADGQRFLLFRTAGQSEAAPITIVLNWQAELKK